MKVPLDTLLESLVLFYMRGKMRSLIWVSNVRRSKWVQGILRKELISLKRCPWWLEQAVGPSKYSHTEWLAKQVLPTEEAALLKLTCQWLEGWSPPEIET